MIFPALSDGAGSYLDILSRDLDYHWSARSNLYTTVDEDLRLSVRIPIALLIETSMIKYREMIMIMRWWSQIMINEPKGSCIQYHIVLLNKKWKPGNRVGFKLQNSDVWTALNKVPAIQIAVGKKRFTRPMAELSLSDGNDSDIKLRCRVLSISWSRLVKA